MAATKHCARCDAEVNSDALWGLCHKCLFEKAGELPAADEVFADGSRSFGDYELGEQIGRGGMGVVYRAVHNKLRRTVALKMLLDSQSGSPQARRRFTFEAEAVAKLDHPHIVPIYEIGEHDGQPFITMKLIAGKTLREHIKSGELCLICRGNGTNRTDVRTRAVDIARLIATVARAVHHAHHQGVLHRDLKPGNILVDKEGAPHLTDFGLAKLVEPPDDCTPATGWTESGTTLGTPAYMSPEQAAGHHLHAASDMYSLGAILYEMLTGEPPFKASTVLEMLRLVADQPARQPSLTNARVDKDLDTICLKCLANNPAARYATAEELAEDLERWLRQEPIRARPAGISLRVGRWVKRNPLGTALILSLCVALAATMGLLKLAVDRSKRDNALIEDANHRFNVELETLWRDPKKTHVMIESSRLTQLAGTTLRPLGSDPIKLSLAAIIGEDPFEQALKYAPILSLVEQRMEKSLGHRVLIDLRLYKFVADGSQAPVAVGEVDFQRLGPVRYMQAKRNVPELQLVAQDKLKKEGVIFARAGAGITNLQQVAGHRVAFAHTNSTISFLTRAYLERVGITARDLKETVNIANPEPWTNSAPPHIFARDRKAANEPENYAHRAVLQAVLEGTFDVGEGPRTHFEMSKYRGPGLIELAKFPVVPDVYVASSKVPAPEVEALRQALLSLGRRQGFFSGQSKRERSLVEQLRSSLEGFEPVTDHNFDELRSMMTNEVLRFETGNRQTPQPTNGSPAAAAK